MKKYLSIIMVFAAFALCGCGDKTTINGYSEEDVAKLLAEAKDTVYQVTDGDSVITYIYVTDTLYNEIVDTVYNRVTDTLYKELVDTIYTRVVDTVVNTLVDTIVSRVIDTVITTMVDTIYTRVIDTVFSTLEVIGVDTELPRDTSITMSAELNGATVSKTFYGIVYKGVFFDTTMYQYADVNHVWVNDRKGDITGYIGEGVKGKAYMPVGEKHHQSDNCSGCDYIKLAYEVPSQCGSLTPPNKGIIHEYVMNRTPLDNYKTPFTGWRMLNDKDAYNIQSIASHIIPDGATVFTSLISKSTKDAEYNYGRVVYYSSYLANVITSTGIKTVEKPMNYMCAYDLN